MPSCGPAASASATAPAQPWSKGGRPCLVFPTKHQRQRAAVISRRCRRRRSRTDHDEQGRGCRRTGRTGGVGRCRRLASKCRADGNAGTGRGTAAIRPLHFIGHGLGAVSESQRIARAGSVGLNVIPVLRPAAEDADVLASDGVHTEVGNRADGDIGKLCDLHFFGRSVRGRRYRKHSRRNGRNACTTLHEPPSTDWQPRDDAAAALIGPGGRIAPGRHYLRRLFRSDDGVSVPV